MNSVGDTMENAQKVVDEWERDTVTEEPFDVARENQKSLSLHSKYIRFYVDAKRSFSKSYAAYHDMKNLRKTYWLGRMNYKECQGYGWLPAGQQMTQTEVKDYLPGDSVLVPLKQELDDWETTIEIVEYILKEIRNRGFAIRSNFEHEKFLSGA